MKGILIFTCLIILASCSTHKNASETVQNDQTTDMDNENLVVGKIRVSDTGCPVYIETFEDGKMLTMYPVNLEDKLKTDGNKIQFSYSPSRGVQPENCIVDKVVALDNVTLLR